uniref:Fibrillarin (FlpA) n=1 Tax=uncultured marine thaumarchaeote AD1000_33_B07 TaxID=1455908 RepID=A0A075FNP6_9ARCH|nr:fibrillarin (flpA) [uncultured marine thaumarchaeote AD1000_33_B07]
MVTCFSNKTRSIDVTKDPRKVIENEIEKLEQSFKIKQIIDLQPYDKDHAMVVATFLG